MLRRVELADGRIRHYSDIGMQIRQTDTGKLYDEAIDVTPLMHAYEETDEPIVGDATVEDYEAALERLGVEV